MKKFIKFWKLSSTFKRRKDKQLEAVLKKEQVVICEFTLPIMPEKDLKEAVRWELPFHLPFADGNYYYDYKKLKDVDGMQLLQAIAVEKELVTQLDEDAKAKGLLLTAVRVECYPGYNLLQDWQKRLSIPKSTLYKWGTVLSLSVAVALCVGSIWYKSVWSARLQVSQQKLEEMANWQKRYDKYSANQKRIETLQKSIKEYYSKRILWSEVLPILGACTPKNCWLTQIKQREENNLLELQGRASNMQEVQGLLEKLQATNKFKDIKLLETMEVKGGLLGYKILLQGRDEAK